MMPPPGQKHSEDCLTLNIITPEVTSKDSEGYPVLVYVHGGAFGWGLAEGYGYKNLSENFVTQGLTVVVIQYRLGALGKLCHIMVVHYYCYINTYCIIFTF